MTTIATQNNRLKYAHLVQVCLAVVLCLCLIDNGEAQLTFHSDANTNSFMLKAPGIQQFFTRNFGTAKGGNLKAHQTDFTVNAGTEVRTDGTTATPTTLATPTTTANLAQTGAQQYQQYNPSHAAHYPQRSAAQSSMQYNGLQHTAYSQAHYATPSAASAQPVRAMARPLVAQQYQQHQSAQHAQLYQAAAAQPPTYARAQPQYEQLRTLEQLQQVEPNDVGSYSSEPQAEQQVAAPQHQQQYLQYQQQQHQKDIQAALLYAYQQQSQQQQQQLQQQQQILAQQQQMKMHNEKYQQQLLKQLYETHPPVIGNRIPGTSYSGREAVPHGRAGTGDQNYTVQNYYDFLQNQHEKTLSDQQQQMQQYRSYATPTDASEVATTLPSSPAAAYSPASQVSSVRYQGGGSQYMFR